MRQKMKQLMGILSSLLMVLGLGMNLTAYAATETYTKLMNDKTVVIFNDHIWYIIADNSTAVNAGTVTLLAADTSFGTSEFGNSSNKYSSSTVKDVLDALTAEGGAFASVKDAIADTDLSDVNVTGAKLYLLSTSEAGPYANFNFTGAESGAWWLRSPGIDIYCAAFVDGESGYVYEFHHDVLEELGVRPALKLNLSSVIFSSDTKTFSLKPYTVTLTGGANAATSGGATSQTGVTMTTVTYTANSGYIFPETSDLYKTTNGITVARTSDTVVTVSGTPKSDVTITIPDAEAKFTVAKGAPVNLPQTGDGTPINLPQTGDSSNVFIHVLVGLLAIAGIGLMIKKR